MSCDHLAALKLAQQGEWDQAHEMVQVCSDSLSCLIHAYLHRVEGDNSNAAYWYRRAGSDIPDNSLEEEFNRLRVLVEQQ